MAANERAKATAKWTQEQIDKAFDVLSTVFLGSAPGSKHGPSSGILELLIPGAVALKGVSPALAKAYRESRKAFEKKPGKYYPFQGELNSMIDDIIHGTLFHGTRRGQGKQLVREGFDVNRMGEKFGLRFGEPSGVSVTPMPWVAENFGGDIVRVGTTTDPKKVVPVFSGRGKDAIMESYLDTVEESEVARNLFRRADRAQVGISPEEVMRYKDAFKVYSDLSQSHYSAYPPWYTPGRRGETFSYINDNMPRSGLMNFNGMLSQYLQDRDVQGLIYNPLRSGGEHEIRMLDPKSVFPVEVRDMQELPNRFLQYKGELSRRFEKALRDTAQSLNEYYSQIPDEKLGLKP